MTTNTTDRQLGWIVVALVAALLVVPALTMGAGMLGHGPMMGDAWSHGMWDTGDGVSGWALVGLGMQLAFLVLVVGAVYLGYRALTGPSPSADPALDELRTAYARGDVDADEFERRRDRLESGQ
ncbi:SHOCT domain-containing protein [Halobacteriales archaeon Cl-PHB]